MKVKELMVGTLYIYESTIYMGVAIPIGFNGMCVGVSIWGLSADSTPPSGFTFIPEDTEVKPLGRLYVDEGTSCLKLVCLKKEVAKK